MRFGITQDVNNEKDVEIYRDATTAFGEAGIRPNSPLESLKQRIGATKDLGSQEALLKMLTSLPSSAKNALLKELLLQHGLAPGVIQGLKSGKTDIKSFELR
jgi:hypothetical protein